jgi:hypothetical protein
MRTKLTKQFLFSLQDGAYLVSNILTWAGPVSAPCWRAHLNGKVNREELWEDAKLCRASGRLVNVVWTKSEFDKLLTGRFV